MILGGGSGGNGKPGNEEVVAKGMADAQLYDLATDPEESNNLISAHPETASRMATVLREQVARGRSTAGPALANDVEIVLPKLTSLPMSSSSR